MKNQFKLKNGRKLSYYSYGAEKGEPVFYFHGFPGSHVEVEMTGIDATAQQHNIRVIAIDRPGYGDSEFQKDRKLLDWPDDVCEVADSLGIKKFSVLGYSGGGPFALACAYKIPTRLKKAVVVSGMGPVNAPGAKEVTTWTLIRFPGFLQSIIFKQMKKIVDTNPDKFHSSMNKSLPAIDLEVLAKNNRKDKFISLTKEAFKKGIKGAKYDANIYKNDWGFQLNEILHPVDLWQGKADENVKTKTADFMASQIQNCNYRSLSNDGHLSLISNYSQEILEAFITH